MIRHDRRIMALCAAAMYGAAAADGLIEGLLPHVPGYSLAPIYAVAVLFGFMLLVGPRLPRGALAINGPLGVVLVSYALATTRATASDSPVLYALPTLWMSLFFGRRGALCVVLCVALGDGLALAALGPYGYPERWVDVMVSVTAIATVTTLLEERNERLLVTLSMEARIDPLTGLLNRRGFDERAAAELRRVIRVSRPYALIVLDIDHFKLVNDKWGHDIGDRVLRHVGGLLRAQAREVDILARFGGEEFVAMLPETDLAGAEAFAERVREALRRQDGGLPVVRLSAGIRAGESAAELAALVADADLALYDAKRAGRDRTQVFVSGQPRAERAAAAV